MDNDGFLDDLAAPRTPLSVPRTRSHVVPEVNRIRRLGHSRGSLASEIVLSPYSFSFSENTGVLLGARLKAIHRSVSVHSAGAEAKTPPKPSESTESLVADLAFHHENNAKAILDYLSGKSPKKSELALLSSLTDSYIDSMPVSSATLARPPTLFRRASSMLFNQDDKSTLALPPKFDSSGKLLSRSPASFTVPLSPQMPSSPPRLPSTPQMRSSPPASSSPGSSPMLYSGAFSSSPVPSLTIGANVHYRGIATPLQHLPTKKANKLAQFTTSIEYPYSIKTMNDIAHTFFKDHPTRDFAAFLPAESHTWLRDWLAAHAGAKVPFCGQLVEINGGLASLWVERSGKDALVWRVNQILSANDALPSSREDFGVSLKCTDHVFRIHASTPTVVLQGSGHLWAPPVIACTLLLCPESLTILDYNEAVMSLLLGTDCDVHGAPIRELIPQFDELWESVKYHCGYPDLTPGVVIPEHMFRAMAGVDIASPEFVSPNPIPDAISLTTEFGKLYIDVNLRVVEPDLISLWISYSLPVSDNKLSVVTPPETPFPSPGLRAVSDKGDDEEMLDEDEEELRELLSIEVGAQRREKKFESFKEVKMLGKGAYGEVRLVLTPSRKHKVVLKSIYKDRILVDTWSRDRVLGIIPNEIRVLNLVRTPPHPNIVQMVDFFEDADCYHVEMIPCMGSEAMDLFDFIETKGDTVSPLQLAQMWMQIVSAVASVHSLGIVHRDLKDENVIIDSHGNAKLIDFGSSAYVNKGPFDVFVGTIDYAAPEVIEGQLYDGIAQDNWALGVLLHVMMMREPPFKSADEIVAAEYPGMSGCFCDSLSQRLLSKHASKRPTAEESLELMKDLIY